MAEGGRKLRGRDYPVPRGRRGRGRPAGVPFPDGEGAVHRPDAGAPVRGRDRGQGHGGRGLPFLPRREARRPRLRDRPGAAAAGGPPAAQEELPAMPPAGAEKPVKRKMPPLGAHVSVAGGVHTAPERGKRIGADVIQIFSKHGTRWAGEGARRGRRPGLPRGDRAHRGEDGGDPLRLPHQPRVLQGDGPHPLALRARGRGLPGRDARGSLHRDASRLLRRGPREGGDRADLLRPPLLRPVPFGGDAPAGKHGGTGEFDRAVDAAASGADGRGRGSPRRRGLPRQRPPLRIRATTSGGRRDGTPCSRRCRRSGSCRWSGCGT